MTENRALSVVKGWLVGWFINTLAVITITKITKQNEENFCS